MRDEPSYLEAIKSNPNDDTARAEYARWLQERGDVRGEYLHLVLALMSLPENHPERPGSVERMRQLRAGMDKTWLRVVDPWLARALRRMQMLPSCDCFRALDEDLPWSEVSLHQEIQDTDCAAWQRLLDLVEESAAREVETFAPRNEMSEEDWARIITLPPSISRLKTVRRLDLCRSHLVRLPPEIGEMTSLEDFDPYQSYRLHWFPYEITRCQGLRDSRVSTRALYGNYKYRPPFPRLQLEGSEASCPGETPLGDNPASVLSCSVCRQHFPADRLCQRWISLRVATDVLPLLVNACSENCLLQLPRPAENYILEMHRGGLAQEQPPQY